MSEAQSAAQPAASRQPVERKVKAATVAAYIVSAAALAVVNLVRSDATVIAMMPAALEPFVVAILPALAAFLAGYQARHTPR